MHFSICQECGDLRYRGKHSVLQPEGVLCHREQCILLAQNSKAQLLKALVEGSLKTCSIILNSVCSFIVGPD